MDYSFVNEMATSTRHNHLIASLMLDIGSLFKRKELFPLQENCALVFYGRKMSGEEALIEPDDLESIEDFVSYAIHEHDFVQPDFLLFHKNKYVQDVHKLKTAGIPDLVVEVWSKYNRAEEKSMKFRIYSSSDRCEHWYIEQDCNAVECYKGKQKLNSQNLKNALVTTTGLRFDLTHMAL